MKLAKTSIGEIFFIASMFVPTVLMGLFKVWSLFWVFLAFGIIFGLMELYWSWKTGKTVSQHFWEWSKKNRKKAIIILVSMVIMWMVLILHLAKEIF